MGGFEQSGILGVQEARVRFQCVVRESLTTKVTSEPRLEGNEWSKPKPHTDRLSRVYQACSQTAIAADVSRNARLEGGGNSEEEATTDHCNRGGEHAILDLLQGGLYCWQLGRDT